MKARKEAGRKEGTVIKMIIAGIILVAICMFIVGYLFRGWIDKERRELDAAIATSSTAFINTLKSLSDLQAPEYKPATEQAPVSETVDCATCGCTIKKELAAEGGSWIKTTPQFIVVDYAGNPIKQKKEIVTPYYCKRCAPKQEEAKTTEQVSDQPKPRDYRVMCAEARSIIYRRLPKLWRTTYKNKILRKGDTAVIGGELFQKPIALVCDKSFTVAFFADAYDLAQIISEQLMEDEVFSAAFSPDIGGTLMDTASGTSMFMNRSSIAFAMDVILRNDCEAEVFYGCQPIKAEGKSK